MIKEISKQLEELHEKDEKWYLHKLQKNVNSRQNWMRLNYE